MWYCGILYCRSFIQGDRCGIAGWFVVDLSAQVELRRYRDELVASCAHRTRHPTDYIHENENSSGRRICRLWSPLSKRSAMAAAEDTSMSRLDTLTLTGSE